MELPPQLVAHDFESGPLTPDFKIDVISVDSHAFERASERNIEIQEVCDALRQGPASIVSSRKSHKILKLLATDVNGQAIHVPTSAVRWDGSNLALKVISAYPLDLEVYEADGFTKHSERPPGHVMFYNSVKGAIGDRAKSWVVALTPKAITQMGDDEEMCDFLHTKSLNVSRLELLDSADLYKGADFTISRAMRDKVADIHCHISPYLKKQWYVTVDSVSWRPCQVQMIPYCKELP